MRREKQRIRLVGGLKKGQGGYPALTPVPPAKSGGVGRKNRAAQGIARVDLQQVCASGEAILSRVFFLIFWSSDLARGIVQQGPP